MRPGSRSIDLGKEVLKMATKHDDKKEYCDCLFSELSSIKDNLSSFVDQIEMMDEKGGGAFCSHAKHLNELISNIDWKMEIFTKECPVDWNTLGKDSEASVSVPTSESLKEKDFPAGGYAGG